MEKLKIVINGNEDIAEKAKEYFGFLGYHISNENRNNCYGWSLDENEGVYYVSVDIFNKDSAKDSARIVTIEQLKDLVVLERNDVGDATHVDRVGEPWFVSSDNKFHSWADDNWAQERENVVSNYNPKPIEKPMKEYLRKNSNGTYSYIGLVHTDHVHDLMIEIPEGADLYTKYDNQNKFYKSKNGVVYRFNECCWIETNWGSISQILEQCEKFDFPVFWKRENNQTIASAVESINDKAKSDEPDFDELERLLIETTKYKPTQEEIDNVNHPLHYASGEIECIDAMQAMLGREQFIGYIRGNMFKYQWRYQNKNGIEDLKKSEWYLNKLLEVENEL